ncbi:protein arginine N-methyltransferase 9-like [Formica exsecta]|uniref:protein arginine N-methyltransferase 9-like n=1 Tax=Formica exsecta TaxID=72781 RepID=UPI0011437180|nr:protein arginine N-methyltransferase 9-like [Formica exsecta]XP_029661157.1 protein arginine N-methyltransferase 9-like [Formica exsecta]XP_029661158.1 protein arginine N-methyltransferase 9-like [Formica exsecta]
MQAEVNDILEKSLQKAREHDRTGNVGRAYAYYTIVAELCPAKRSEIEETFTDVLCEWGIQLAEDNRFSDVVRCYKHSLDIYPNNPRMLNNFAAHLLRNNNPIRATEYLKRALKVDPNFLPAERNLQNAYSMAVDRWHFTMLNDKWRNNAFERAICKRINQGYDTVLDVGTGTGLLSLYAKTAGATKVYACECSEIMTLIAKEVFESNNATDIKLIPKLSFDLKIPLDISERVKLIVTETFDAGLFGELVVPSMINVHMNILDMNGMVIPMGATVYTAAIECEHIRYRSSVVFDRIKDSTLNFNKVSILSDDEYYDTENLEKVQINYVTEPQILFNVNFNNLLQLQEFYKDGIKQMLQVKCRYDGIIDGLVAWFKLHLDEEITLDSSDGKSCWQLAVFPAIPVVCHEGDILTIKAETSKSKLKCSYSTGNAQSSEDCKFLYRLAKEVIVFLNDFNYVKLLTEVARYQENKKIKYILDTSPFPIYGLTLLKECKDSEILYYKTDNEILRFLIEQIARDSGLRGKVHMISNYDEIPCSLDSVFVHNFDIKGELKDDQDSCYGIFRHLLKPNGVLLPEKIFLMGQLVYSEDLPNMVYVQDVNLQKSSNTSICIDDDLKSSDNEDNPHSRNNTANKVNKSTNYIVAEHINKYKINQIFDLNSSLYSCEIMSEAQTLIEMNGTETTEAVVNFGQMNSTKRKTLPNALICWYKVQLSSQHIHDTKKNDSFMNHTAIVFEDELRNIILKDKEIKIKVHQMKGLVKITVLNL